MQTYTCNTLNHILKLKLGPKFEKKNLSRKKKSLQTGDAINCDIINNCCKTMVVTS